MPIPIIIYGAADCDDTERTREYLNANQIPFQEVNISEDKDAERFVVFINGGFRSTPTVIVGEGKLRVILTEPTNEQIDSVLKRSIDFISG